MASVLMSRISGAWVLRSSGAQALRSSGAKVFRSSRLLLGHGELRTLVQRSAMPAAGALPSNKRESFAKAGIRDAAEEVRVVGSEKLRGVSKELSLKEWVAVYQDLGKFKLCSLVTMTAAAGYAVAVPVGVGIGFHTMAVTCVGTGLAAMSASAFNQIFEIPNDKRMTRTTKRPLVTGKLSPLHATVVASAAGVGGVSLLLFQVNPLTAGLAAANIGLYALVYTPMKQHSIWNTWVGAVVGAIPPVMGWAAATGGVDLGALLMGGVLFSWQMPHFLSLAYMMRRDYIAGGFKMMPGEPGTAELTRATNATMRHCLYLEAICCGAPMLGIVHPYFAVEATLLNGIFFYLSAQFHKAGGEGSSGKTNTAARRLFLFSLLYLPALLGFAVLHRAKVATPALEDKIGCPFLDASKMVSEQGSSIAVTVPNKTSKSWFSHS